MCSLDFRVHPKVHVKGGFDWGFPGNASGYDERDAEPTESFMRFGI